MKKFIFKFIIIYSVVLIWLIGLANSVLYSFYTYSIFFILFLIIISPILFIFLTWNIKKGLIKKIIYSSLIFAILIFVSITSFKFTEKFIPPSENDGCEKCTVPSIF